MTARVETMQGACERAQAVRNLACARRLRDLQDRTPVQQAAYVDAVAGFKMQRRMARAMRAPSRAHADRTVWAPLAKGVRS